ncbi:Cyclase atC [Lachnellula suecica]|uniref:Cyclase atC n=1 Tax=Lachnellula suecica TaxID=602035 RepID=A0A8T9C856_9HELO|nr:Cyclase atC [Lachnellula suecica]
MKHSVFTTLLGASLLKSAAGFGSRIANGKTQLLGNNVGILAQNTTFDYVVVGGGTAGLTIATRLADAKFSVAVVEAGGFYELDNGNTSQVPGYGGKYLTFNDLSPSPVLVDWDLITEAQPGLNNRQIHYTSGKALGGSSALNDQIYQRSTKGAYDQWVDLVGDDNYSWENFLPYLSKSPQFTPPNLAKIGVNYSIAYDASVYSSTGGPLQVSYPNYFQPFDEYLKTAFASSGLAEIEGLASGHLDGYAASTLILDPATQTRSSSEASFFQTALDSTSLTAYIKTQAQKVLFDDDKQATGVLVETNGATYTLTASKEVILSAGVFHSPQILMLSGFGIPVLSDLPGVGQNLWDHVFIFTNHEMDLTTNSAVLSDPSLQAVAAEIYLSNQSGPLTGIGGSFIGWERNNTGLSNATLAALATNFSTDWPYYEYLGLSSGSNPTDEPSANNYMFLTTALQSILSRGYVSIRSANISDPPIIDPNALSTDAEKELAVAALKRLRQFAEASRRHIRESNPGSDYTTDSQILEWIQNNGVNGYHAACTCAMGRANDSMSVLDSQTRVYGVKGLRVVDASAMPLLPPGHPMGSIFALAEKTAADIIEGI